MKPIRLDPDDKQLQQTALGLLAAGDWGGLTALARALPPQSAYAMLQLLAEAAPLTADVSHLIASKDAMDLTVAGALLHGRAVRHRGVGMAEDVTEDQWELYIPTLAHAQELLAEANRRAPELGLAAAWRVSAFIDATEEQKDEAEIALRRATGIPVSGLLRLISMRSEKWGGWWRIMPRLPCPARSPSSPRRISSNGSGIRRSMRVPMPRPRQKPICTERTCGRI
jgi:hypothetical protein